MAWQCHMTTHIWVNIGSANGLLPDDTKTLPEVLLTYHQQGSFGIHIRDISQITISSCIMILKITLFEITFAFPRGPWVNVIQTHSPSYIPMICLGQSQLTTVHPKNYAHSPSHDDIINWKHFSHNRPFWESTCHRWIPCTKTSDAELWCFLWSGPEWTVE